MQGRHLSVLTLKNHLTYYNIPTYISNDTDKLIVCYATRHKAFKIILS